MIEGERHAVEGEAWKWSPQMVGDKDDLGDGIGGSHRH